MFCAKSELTLFDALPIQVSVERGQWIDVHPINTIRGTGPIEFQVSGSGDSYFDLNDSYLYIRYHVASKEANFAPVNSMLYSLFSDVRLSLNEKQIEGGHFMNGYKGYLTQLMQYGIDAKASHMTLAGYSKDKNLNSVDNPGHRSRMKLVQGGESTELVGPIMLDMFSQSKYLLSNVDMKLSFHKAQPEFCLNNFNEGELSAKIIFDEAILYLRKCQVSQSVSQGHESGLLKREIIYPIQRTELQTIIVPAGLKSTNRENLFRGILPKLIVLGMVTNSAFNGNYRENPYNFQHFSMKSIALYIDGEAQPYRPFTPNFEKRFAVREYLTLFQGMNMFNKDEGNCLTYDEFLNGYTLMAFNLAPDQTICGLKQLQRDSNIRLEIMFERPLEKAINIILFSVYDGEVRIDKNRNVFAL